MKYLHGDRLRAFVERELPADIGERSPLSELHEFMLTAGSKKVCCLYGLKYSGKRTMMLQELRKLADYGRSLFISCESGDTVRDITDIIDRYSECVYVFIDEITKTSDFITRSAVLADVYAMTGKKLVLSGTDSLGFVFARQHALYDRTLFINTTYIPFGEYNRLTDRGITNYIRSGGLFLPEETLSDSGAFSGYIDTAVIGNIVNSLQKSDERVSEGCLVFGEMLENGSLPSFIDRTAGCHARTFLADIVARDSDAAAERVRGFTYIADEKRVGLIFSYLEKLGVLYRVNGSRRGGYISAVPCVRYRYASFLLRELLASDIFENCTPREKESLYEKWEGKLLCGILSDAVLLQMSEQFSSRDGLLGDMLVERYGEYPAETVVMDFTRHTAVAVEAALSAECSEDRVLLSGALRAGLQAKTGLPVINDVILYLGETRGKNGVIYVNAEDFLRSSDTLIPFLLSRRCESGGELEELIGS